jgi:hypothetical protein
MPIWNVYPVHEEPELHLGQWNIYEAWCMENAEGATRHFVGINTRRNTGRVSSAIQTFDRQAMLGVTCTGRVYELVGRAGRSMDADYVWSEWRSLNGVIGWKDVTNEVAQSEVGSTAQRRLQ